MKSFRKNRVAILTVHCTFLTILTILSPIFVYLATAYENYSPATPTPPDQYIQELLHRYKSNPSSHHPPSSSTPYYGDGKGVSSSTPDPRYYGDREPSYYRPISPATPSSNGDYYNRDRDRDYRDKFRDPVGGVGGTDPRYRYDHAYGRSDSTPPPPISSGGHAGSGGSYPNYPSNPLLPEQYSFREDEILRILAQIDSSSSQQCNNNVRAQWEYETNVNEISQIRAMEQQLALADFQRNILHAIDKLDNKGELNFNLQRELRMVSNIGVNALPPDQLNRYNRLINDMLAIYNTASVCDHEQPLNCGLRLENINVIMAGSRDWDELQHVWIEWHRKTGQTTREHYIQLVDLSNYAAHLNNFTDTAEMWMFPYEMSNFRKEIEESWYQIKPLYEQLHAYVRRKLRDLYGPEKISRDAPLPAHILGNMWAQSWENILDIVIPYPGNNFLDVSPEMMNQGYTPEIMFRIAEQFFVSMNMSAMPVEFWSRSIIDSVPGRPLVCQASAWDFCNGLDYRIKMCTHVTMKDFVKVHHEMTHIQYFLNYRHLPKVFRDGANPAFHEAVSDAISLSISNMKHMQTLGLVTTVVDDIPHNINYLFQLAMEKLTLMPFSLALDMWRWDVFSGYIQKERYNCHWWDLRERFSGVKPPILRSEINFDPGAKYHVPANIPFIGNYVSGVLEFQIFRALCKAAGQYIENDPRKPLHKCDIYRSKEAGTKLKLLMETGSSRRWQDTLRNSIGDTGLDPTALRDFFRPLEEWLRNENLRTGEFVGWIYDGDYCKFSIETANLQVSGGIYNVAAPTPTSCISLMLISCVCTVVIMRRRF